MLVSAQEELILARRLVDQASAGKSERAAANARDLLSSARQRLSYWDIPEEEIEQIEHALVPRKTLTFRAGAGGIVVEKNVVEGSRIMPGMDLYKIADLSRVWINGELFEKDISLVRQGQRAEVTFDAYPGEDFHGVVTYVYPSVSLEARTGQVRLELSNPGLKLMPGMYAQVEIRSTSPREALLIPRSAVLVTGERSLVFVRESDGMLTPREVHAGLVAGGDIEILSGLTAGEVVVTSPPGPWPEWTWDLRQGDRGMTCPPYRLLPR
jgi:RND family efflux transporter MFP subunit